MDDLSTYVFAYHIPVYNINISTFTILLLLLLLLLLHNICAV